MLKLLSRNFRVTGVGDRELKALFTLLLRGGGGERWVFLPQEGGYFGIHGRSAEEVTVEDPYPFLKSRSSKGFLFPDGVGTAYLERFPEVTDFRLPLRLASYIAPLIPDLHPEVQGIHYDFQPSERNRAAIALFRRFLPRNKAVVLSFPFGDSPFGIVLGFDEHHALSEVIGAHRWPFLPAEGERLRELSLMGKPVELGVHLTRCGMERLVESGLSRSLLRELLKEGELRLDPLPILLRMALFAAKKA